MQCHSHIGDAVPDSDGFKYTYDIGAVEKAGTFVFFPLCNFELSFECPH
jgi:hypothetical protein